MDTNALKAALLIQAQGSIAGAARALGVDASSVSRILAGVEAELGTRLFQRTTRKLSVTDEGRAFLARLKPLIEELEAAQEEAR
ncbi:MAG: LysR family transcriptional regulator, partial [Pseudomonadota bacterium]